MRHGTAARVFIFECGCYDHASAVALRFKASPSATLQFSAADYSVLVFALAPHSKARNDQERAFELP
jgi:hypothetical protein